MGEASLKNRARESFVPQRNVTECGAACLAALIRYHGQEIELDRLCEIVGAGDRGTTLQELLEAAETVGLEAGGYEADIESLGSLDVPCILHVVKGEGRQHYVVCYGTSDGKFIIGDPESGIDDVHPAMLAKQWHSRALLKTEPAADFAENVEKARTMDLEPSASEDDADETYRSFAEGSTPFGLNQIVLDAAGSESPHVLPASWGQLLLSLDHFDTLENHASACVRRMDRVSQENAAPGLETDSASEDEDQADSSSQLENIEHQLRQYAKAGLLISKSEVREQIQSLASRSSDSPPPITSVCIPTAGRPERLRRAVSSYIHDAQGRDHPPDFVVMDDAEDADARTQTREVLEEVQDRTGARVLYADRADRREFAETLADHAGVPSSVARFALLGNKQHANTYGAPRNAALLHTVGELSVQVDDDTVCKMATPPGGEDTLSLTSEALPQQGWFFDDRPSLLSDVSFDSTGFLEAHEKLLGKTVGRCLSDLAAQDQAVHVGEIDATFLQEITENEVGVALSFAGWMGNPGRFSKRFRLLSDDATFARLVENYGDHIDAREVMRAPTRPTLTDGSICVSMNVGIDNRTPVPPFMPVGKGEDHIFGLVLKMCSSHMCQGYLPTSLLHDPQRDRSSEAGSVQFEGFSAHQILLHLMTAVNEWIGTGDGSSLPSLGRYLQDVGSLSESAFNDYCERRCREALSERVRSAEQDLLRRQGAPAGWKEDVREYLRSTTNAAQEGTLSVPEDLSGTQGERQSVLREFVRRYGELLRHWSALREAATDLKEKGVRMPKKL